MEKGDRAILAGRPRSLQKQLLPELCDTLPFYKNIVVQVALVKFSRSPLLYYQVAVSCIHSLLAVSLFACCWNLLPVVLVCSNDGGDDNGAV